MLTSAESTWGRVEVTHHGIPRMSCLAGMPACANFCRPSVAELRGELAPAITFSAPLFSTKNQIILEGRALQRGESAAGLKINGGVVSVSDDGRFAHPEGAQGEMGHARSWSCLGPLGFL